jgi:hypothetical protein
MNLMSEGAIELAYELVTLGGAVAGYASTLYIVLKRIKKRIRVYDVCGTYETRESGHKGSADINVMIDVAFLNDSDETVSITDIIGTLKYNKELYDKATSSINVPRIPDVHSARPENFDQVVNFSISPHETIKKRLKITFPNMIVDYVDRLGLAHFGGFLDGKIPFLRVEETELKEKWSEHPLTLLLSIHVDGKRKYHTYVMLWKNNEKAASGTMSIIDIEKIKKDYREGKELSRFSR